MLFSNFISEFNCFASLHIMDFALIRLSTGSTIFDLCNFLKINPMKKRNIRVFGIPLNQKTMVRWKIYIDRARMYINYINFIMIAFVFLNSFENEGIRHLLDDNKLLVYPLIMILFFTVSLILGRFDTKLGLRKEEMRNNATENPVMMEILSSLQEIRESQRKMIDVKTQNRES